MNQVMLQADTDISDTYLSEQDMLELHKIQVLNLRTSGIWAEENISVCFIATPELS
jgi:hypothetical protein